MKETKIDVETATPAPQPEMSDARMKEWFWSVMLCIVSLWGLSIYFFGLPGFFMPALLLTPVIFGYLLIITRGG
ncbi:MAG: hypothetical protein AAGI50_08840 [Pseudomonadota bacterium]